MEASQTTSQSLSPKRDDVEIRPETVLQKTIKEAENAHKEQQVRCDTPLLSHNSININNNFILMNND